MAFMSILLLDAAIMAVMLGVVGAGALGLVACVVFLALWVRARRRGGGHQRLFLALGIAGGVLALMGLAVLTLLIM